MSGSTCSRISLAPTAKGLKLKTAAATEALKNFADLSDKAVVANEIIAGLNADIATHQRTQPSVALEGIFIRDEIRQAAGVPAGLSEIASHAIWSQDVRVGQILELMPAVKHRRALHSYKESNSALWHEALLVTMNGVGAKLAGEIATLLIQEGKLDQLKEIGRASCRERV